MIMSITWGMKIMYMNDNRWTFVLILNDGGFCDALKMPKVKINNTITDGGVAPQCSFT